MIINKEAIMTFRNTKQKSIIYSCIDKHGHVTIEQLIDLLKNENISVATIYRNINILSLENKIKKVSSDDKIVYEINKNDHYHFECRCCKKIYDIPTSLIKVSIDHSISSVTNKSIVLYGICKDCQLN